MSNKDYHLNKKLQRRYGITIEQYRKMLDEQNSLCLICHLPETYIRNGEVKNLSVDHSHVNGKVRGLLCHSCNLAIGLLKDNPDTMRSAAEYIEKNKTN